MSKWLKWLAVAGGALLLLGATKRASAGAGSGADAPGVRLGDVSYARYKAAWITARSKNAEGFALIGVLTFTAPPVGNKVRYTYTWWTSDGSLSKQTSTGNS